MRPKMYQYKKMTQKRKQNIKHKDSRGKSDP